MQSPAGVPAPGSPPTLAPADQGVEAALAPPPGNPRFALLDAVRGLATLGVIVFHLVQRVDLGIGRIGNGLGNQGLAVFFVLSGFLLYRPFVSSRWTGTPPIRVPRYLKRRLLRVVPAFWVALTVLAIWPGIPNFFGNGGRDTLIYYGFLQNYSDGTRYGGLVVSWSLSLEMTFYVILPLLALAPLWLARRLRAGGGPLGWLEVAVVGAFAATSLLYAIRPSSPELLPRYADWFGMGMALALLSVWEHHRRRNGGKGPPEVVMHFLGHARLAWSAALALYLVVTLNDVSGYLAHLSNAICAGLVVAPAIFQREGSKAGAVLAHPVLAWFGLVSYGMYLYHLTVLAQLDALDLGTVIIIVGVVPITCVLAALSYYLVERPILRWK